MHVECSLYIGGGIPILDPATHTIVVNSTVKKEPWGLFVSELNIFGVKLFPFFLVQSKPSLFQNSIKLLIQAV